MSRRVLLLLLSLLLVFTFSSCNGEVPTTDASTPEASEAETTDTSDTTQPTQPTQGSSDHQSTPGQDPTEPEPAVMISVELSIFRSMTDRINDFYDLSEGATVGDLHRAYLQKYHASDAEAPAFSDFNWKIDGEKVDADAVLKDGTKVVATPAPKDDGGNDTGRY